ncbi:arsenate reductase/protein-tyrosine-phosphatase family protein [Jannaschia marina]|uniref:arsenate reductase/protein-tyrosine-phosphatase family protein n=1 Tax=Jannaschia marina TaxID=2741674 RepID=UPI0015C8C4FF|nr:helix-turn-helix domain-containing protein [Jannaschia marina]
MESLNSPADALALLGHQGRLDVFRLLMARHPDALPAGEIAAVLAVPASTLSSYLAALHRQGLISRRREATTLLYSANLPAVRALFDGLMRDCCRGRYDLCLPVFPKPLQGDTKMTDRKYSVLFVCSGNSSRSIFAESILRDIAGDRFEAFSAGVAPHSTLNPFAVKLLESKGLDTRPLRAKSIGEFQGPDAPPLDFVFTVCDVAGNEVCAPWADCPVTSQWSTADPVKATGTDGERSLAFQRAYGALRNRIVTFTALPIETLDRMAVQSAVDEIGRQDDVAPA